MLSPRIYILFAATLLLTSCNQSASEKEEKTIHNVFITMPVPTEGSLVRDFAGRVDEARALSVGFKTAGEIQHIYVKDGQHVRKGELIATLDSTDYVLGITQLRIQSRQYTDEFERMTKLYATGSVSDNDYEKAKAGIEQLSYQVALNEKKLSYCRLYAPTNGIVTDVKFEVGELVNEGTPVVDLMDNTHLEVTVDLPVKEYLRRSTFDSFIGHTPLLPGQTFPLQMLSLTPRADNNQLYQLKLGLSGSNVDLTPGMNITVQITCSNSGNTDVSVPASAVFDVDGHTAVYIFNPTDSVITMTPVTVSGTEHNGSLTISSGLTQTDHIVRAGVHHLVNGEKVNVIPPASETNIGNTL